MIASLTTRGFGVVATIDTVVRGTLGFTSFISVKSKPLATSGGSSIRWAMTFSLPPVVGVADLNLACRSVDRGIHRLLKRRTSSNKVVAQESECAALREYGRVLIDRTIFETKCQMVGYAIAPCVLRHLTIGERLAFKGPHHKKAMDQAFGVAHRDRICERRVWLEHGGTGQQNRDQCGPGP